MSLESGIFVADDGQRATGTRGVLRGPHGPKNDYIFIHEKHELGSTFFPSMKHSSFCGAADIERFATALKRRHENFGAKTQMS